MRRSIDQLLLRAIATAGRMVEKVPEIFSRRVVVPGRGYQHYPNLGLRLSRVQQLGELLIHG
jgi:hypothetical protein